MKDSRFTNPGFSGKNSNMPGDTRMKEKTDLQTLNARADSRILRDLKRIAGRYAAMILIAAAPLLLTGCLQKGVQRNMVDRIFTFKESDKAVTDTGIKVEWAQIYGDFNQDGTSVQDWHFYHFNDEGIDPDEAAHDGKWTTRVAVFEGRTYYKFKIGGTKDGAKKDSTIFDPNNPEKFKDVIKDKEWSVLYLK